MWLDICNNLFMLIIVMFIILIVLVLIMLHLNKLSKRQCRGSLQISVNTTESDYMFYLYLAR